MSSVNNENNSTYQVVENKVQRRSYFPLFTLLGYHYHHLFEFQIKKIILKSINKYFQLGLKIGE
jgi:hypothetical protein